jgi:hypothetical protein
VKPRALKTSDLSLVPRAPRFLGQFQGRSRHALSRSPSHWELWLVVTWDPTNPNSYGINLENYGVAPEVWVENNTADELSATDRAQAGPCGPGGHFFFHRIPVASICFPHLFPADDSPIHL